MSSTNTRMATYKVFKGYISKDKRTTSNKINLRNTVWDLASKNPKPSDVTFTAALDRYTELEKKATKTPLEEDEYNTLKLLLHRYKKINPLTPNSFKSILPLVFTKEALASRNAASVAVPAPSADPQSIQDTIKKMRCTVCESQSIIDKALKPGEAPRKCDFCVAKAVAAAAAAASSPAGAPAVAVSGNPFNGPGELPKPTPFNNNNNVFGQFEGGRRSRRRHRKTSRRTKNKRSTRRR